jgi:cystathionine beta-lyase/cystathionine gamma-synthase
VNRQQLPENARIATRALHERSDLFSSSISSAPDVVMSNSFLAEATAGFSAETFNSDAAYFYTRWSNPTVTRLERTIASLETAEGAVCFATGMAAVTGLILHLAKSGDHIVVSDVVYAGVSEWVHQKLTNLNIQVTRVDASDLPAIEHAVRSNTKLIYIETPCNPILRLTDIAAVSAIAHKSGATLAVDSTMATPVATRPLELGADFVVHSLSKYIGGHGDALGGVVAGRHELIESLRKDSGIHLGGSLSPFNAWLILRGVATFPIRMKAHSAGALRVAEFLEKHPRVSKVVYPGLPSHPQHLLATRQMQVPSGMLTFQIDGTSESASRLSERLRIIHYAVSLGHVRSLIFYLPTNDLLRTSFLLSSEQEASYRAYAGNGIFRMSVGLEDPEDLCEDLSGALDEPS